MSLQLHEDERLLNPLDLLEELITANDWPFDRTSESELVMEVEGRWCGYRMCFVWQADVSAIFFSCFFETKVPEAKKGAIHELLSRVNETLWLGHFEISSDPVMPLFRHTVPLRGAAGASVEQLEDLVDTAVVECERFYPALQLVLWGGHDVEKAMQVALMETVGEA